MGGVVLHPLLQALIDTLPKTGPFPEERRQAFQRMLANAFDVAYGPGVAEVAPAATSRPASASSLTPPPSVSSNTLPPAMVVDCWHVDSDGLARTPQGHEANFDAVPPGTIFVDYRAAPNNGSSDGVIFSDGTYPLKAIASKRIQFKVHETAAAA